MTKEELRKEALEKRRSIVAEERDVLNMRIFDRAHKVSAFQLAQRVNIYRSMPDEVDTRLFFEYAWGIGKEVYSPFLLLQTTMMHAPVTRDTVWVQGPLGVLQPQINDPAVLLASEQFDERSAVITPLVAFDAQCNRIGFGKGFYDRFFSVSTAASIGLGYECQRVSTIPANEHDMHLDCIASEERLYRR